MAVAVFYFSECGPPFLGLGFFWRMVAVFIFANSRSRAFLGLLFRDNSLRNSRFGMSFPSRNQSQITLVFLSAHPGARVTSHLPGLDFGCFFFDRCCIYCTLWLI